MIEITNLKNAKKLSIGEHFIFGEYEDEPIEWIKIGKKLAVSEKILERIAFNKEDSNKYSISTIRKWCNKMLGSALNLTNDTIFVPNYRQISRYFSTVESRQAKPTEWARMHGIFVDEDGYSSYWTRSRSFYALYGTFIVKHSGLVVPSVTCNSSVGVRPALKLK